MAKRTHWTEAQARAIVAECQASGLSMAEYGRQRDVHPERIRKWRARFRREEAAQGPRLVELVPRAQRPGSRIQVHCPSGHSVEVFEAELLAGLLAALTAVAEVSRC